MVKPTEARRIALLGALYFVQGLPFGFQAHALPVYLRERGVSLTAIGLLGALSLPWMTKALWAPLVDRFGTRKAWIVPMQLGLALTCGLAALVPPERGLGLLLALVFLMNLFAATQDIAVDGLAVDLLGERELGPGNAAQVVGYKAGMLTSGGLLVYATADIGWQGVFAAMAALVAVVLFVVAAWREPPREVPLHRQTLGGIVKALGAAVVVPGGVWMLAVVATYKLGESMVDAMWKPFLIDAGFSKGQIGLWFGTYGMAASTVGSILGGWAAARMGPSRALLLAAVARVFPLFAEWALAAAGHPSAAQVIGAGMAEHLFGGALTVALFAFMMARVDRRIGATHYTLLATIEVLGKSPPSWASGALADQVGYAPVFAAGVALSAAFVGVLWPLRRRPTG